MALSLADLRLVVPDRVVTRQVEATTVLLDTETGRSFTLDDVGTRVWALLTSSPSAQTAYAALLAEYEVDPEELRRDLESLIENLGARGLVEIHADVKAMSATPPAAADAEPLKDA